MIPVITTITLFFFGLVFPVWLFMTCLFIAALLIPRYWGAVVVGVLLNLVYVDASASFGALYVVWGVAAFVFSVLVKELTRFHKPKDII